MNWILKNAVYILLGVIAAMGVSLLVTTLKLAGSKVVTAGLRGEVATLQSQAVMRDMEKAGLEASLHAQSVSIEKWRRQAESQAHESERIKAAARRDLAAADVRIARLRASDPKSCSEAVSTVREMLGL